MSDTLPLLNLCLTEEDHNMLSSTDAPEFLGVRIVRAVGSEGYRGDIVAWGTQEEVEQAISGIYVVPNSVEDYRFEVWQTKHLREYMDSMGKAGLN